MAYLVIIILGYNSIKNKNRGTYKKRLFYLKIFNFIKII